jgi:methionine sulfoxide reductase heme-binding subunit
LKPAALLHPAVRPGLHVLCALPLLWFVYAAVANRLGANPAEALVRGLGDWGLRALLLTLAVTPLRTLLKQPLLVRYRRALGLWSFAYVLLHLLAYAWFDKGLELTAVLNDIVKRPFILVGMNGFLLLLPLALTSFNAAIKALGGKRWQALHRLVYAALMLGCLHFWWMRSAKNNLTEPMVYAGLATVLLGWRLWHRWKGQRPTQARAQAAG